MVESSSSFQGQKIIRLMEFSNAVSTFFFVFPISSLVAALTVMVVVLILVKLLLGSGNWDKSPIRQG